MARRIELGAGLAAAVLTIFTLAMLLSAPLVPICPGGTTGGRCASAPRLISLTAAGSSVGASVWITIIVMALATLVGGTGAVLDGQLGQRIGTLLLWPAALVALGGWVVTSTRGSALSLFFVPPVLALSIAALAACAALAARRGHAPRHRATTADPGGIDESAGRAAHGGQT